MVGVYLIRNVANGMFYIGSSVNINDRFSTHISKLKSNMNQNKKMQIDFNLFGKSVFVLEILELCERDKLRQRERYYIEKLKPSYNKFIPSKTGSHAIYLGKKKEKKRLNDLSAYMSIATKNHWQSLSEEQRTKRNAHKVGKVFSEETKQKLREAKLGRKLTEETKLKIKNTLKGKKEKA